jgi:hypothetical protein
LYNALKVVQDSIYEPFCKFDRQAVENRRHYEIISVLAVVFGALSVLIALSGPLADLYGLANLWKVEAAMAAAAVFCIVFGWFAGFKDKWLTARCKAERLRLKKFEKLLDPELWCEPPDLDSASEKLKREVHEISVENSEKSREWAKSATELDMSGAPCKDRCERSLAELVDYYVPKRLRMQMAYLEQRWPKDEKLGGGTAALVNVFFFGGFFFVLGHLAMHSLKEHEKMTAWFAVAALGLPIVAAAFRTFRASREFERNAMRHHATHDSLSKMSSDLANARDLEAKFRIIGFCETILEADCREFMRLVAEAEWYG